MVETSVWPEIESLYRSDFARFVRVARAVAGDPDSAIEAVQEGFADALRNAGQWQGCGPLEGWVWRCVLNRARKARPRRALELWAAEDSRNGSDGAGDAELRVRLAALPDRQRLVVFLRYFADLEYREIASALGIEVGTVSARILAPGLRPGGRPDWSPDGNTILVRTHPGDDPSGIGANLYTIHPDGTGLHQLTHFSAYTRVLDGSYSSDGKSIVFETSDGAVGSVLPDVFVMNADGTDIGPITHTRNFETGADWGPAG